MLYHYSIAKLNSDIIHHYLPKMPQGIDLIVAIPRDGILVASLVSLYRQIPFTDLGAFLEGRIYRPGKKHRVKPIYNCQVKRILIVDDICATGSAMREAKAEIAKLQYDISVCASTLYAFGGEQKVKSRLIDFYGVEMKSPSHYDWTLCDMFRSIKTGFDFDGVLCPDCPPGCDDQGIRYKNFILNAPLKLKPNQMGAIITWRPEKFRRETEQWLAEYKITYNQLIMADRAKWKNPVEFKAFHYKNSMLTLYVESSTRQAQEIARLTGKPVLSLETQEMF